VATQRWLEKKAAPNFWFLKSKNIRKHLGNLPGYKNTNTQLVYDRIINKEIKTRTVFCSRVNFKFTILQKDN